MITSTRNEFQKRFQKEAVWTVAAPGRVNLIGEHTDYNDGFVFPMAIERYTVISAAPGAGDVSRVFSTNMNSETEIYPNAPVVSPQKPAWSDYIQGVVSCCKEAGFAVPAFDAVLSSDVPLGGGLSSSASLEVAVATLIEAISGRKIDLVEKALICQKAEHVFAKMPCGIMDQFISTMGKAGFAMLLDCRSKKPKMVPMNDPGISVLITNSNVKHALTGSEYPERRAQCEKVAKYFGLEVLRDLTLETLEKAKDRLISETGSDLAYRRAYHVVTENDRTVEMAEALAACEWARCGELMYASHDSLSRDFEVSCEELDILVGIAREIGRENGMIGSRMTGGGFGGCTVSLVKTEKFESITEAIFKKYREKTGISPTIFATRPAEGAQMI